MKWIGLSGYRKPLNFEILHNTLYFEGTPQEFLAHTVSYVNRALALFDSRIDH